jgi:hypothetical protein
VDAYFSFLESIRLDDPSISEKMKDAVNYSLNQKKYLCRFLKSGDVPIDNGFCLSAEITYPHLLTEGRIDPVSTTKKCA